LPPADHFSDIKRIEREKKGASMNATKKWAAALACALALGMQGAAAAGLFAYVANNEADSVSVIDAASHTVIATVPVGTGPSSVAASPDGRFVYVTNNRGPDFSVSVIEVSSNRVVATVPTGSTPTGVAVSPDGRFAYVVNRGAGTVSAIDTATNAVVATTTFGDSTFGAISLAVSPDGLSLYIANASTSTVSVVDVTSGAVRATVPMRAGSMPFDVAATPDGRFAYVVNLLGFEDDTLVVIDTATNSVVAKAALEILGRGIAVHPGGRTAYVTQALTNTLAVVDLATNGSSIAPIPTGANPFRVAVSPDGRFAYVTNQDVASVSVIDTASNLNIATIPVGAVPQGVAFAGSAPDAVAPTATAGAAPAANAAGWNNGAVTVMLSATDNQNGSGVESITYSVGGTTNTVPAAAASFPVSAEGISTITYRATDKAGNAGAAQTLVVRIDRAAPVSTATANPPADAGGKNTGPVTVSIVAADGGSGVRSISVLRTSGGSTAGDTFPGASASVVVSAAGETTVSYSSTDNAGNVEPARTLTIRIEAAPAKPFTAKLSALPAVLWPADGGLHSIATHLKTTNAVGRVKVTHVAVTSDEPVGRSSPDWVVSGRNVKLRAERSDRGDGRIYTITYTVTDEAGNTAQASDTVAVPKRLPWGHWGWGDRHSHYDHDRRR
jgi:YVTN family beta-propeller protein